MRDITSVTHIQIHGVNVPVKRHGISSFLVLLPTSTRLPQGARWVGFRERWQEGRLAEIPAAGAILIRARPEKPAKPGA